MGVFLLDYLYKKASDAQEGSMSQGNLALELQSTLLLFLAKKIIWGWYITSVILNPAIEPI